MGFYRSAAVAIMLAWSAAPAAQARFGMFESGVLHAHNSERRLVGAAPLMWSAGLASAADQQALRLARTDRFGHSPARQLGGQGENLWMGSRGAYRPTTMVAAWASEKRVFRAGLFPNVSRTGSWSHVGHYTQMVWPATTSVGCSVRSSAQWDYLVCRYAAAGNVVGQRVGAIRYAAR